MTGKNTGKNTGKITRTIGWAAALAVLSGLAGAAQAQQLAGGRLEIETAAFVEAAELGFTTYSGGLQFDVGAGFGAQIDLASYGFMGFGSDGTNATVHGLYDLGGATVGLFAGRDGYEEGDATIYGIEGETYFYGGEVEAYLARHDGEIGEITVAGLSGRMEVAPRIAAHGELGFADSAREGHLLRAALGGGYAFDEGFDLWGEIGRVESDDDAFGEDETFISVGATIGFGLRSGTSFGNRSLFDVVPGF
ncbi:hypothetical protein [Limimaricola pyoseonensis]|uniref:Outer membrane protein beta-barrel domain-containing protein n=1 Tax=Limimaricola pyoseonensis TaxID=521013 RepID=A0A1G7G6Z5_9RHOB|nr:hypothetical protein [Limimaricola pyoseonensis]SDE83890.1 hypothetical protein SAMN04488567_2755 [Limimaricola pyoseonensis]